MNSLKNSVRLLGNVGSSPVIRNMDNGKIVGNFSIATSEQYNDKEGNKKETTHWHRIVAWNNTATLVEKLISKGVRIALEGKLTSHSYENKEGQTVYVTEVLLNEFLLLTPKPKD